MGPIQPIISHVMLDTLQGVLIAIGLPEAITDAARHAVEAAATDGVVGQAPYVVLAGGVQPIKDAEDRGVLETAIAGSSDLLVTNNMADFVPGTRADIDAEIVHADAKGKVDVLLLKHGRLPHGLAITSVFAAKAWLLDGMPPPAGILARFLPAVPRRAG
jgi:hypothetical protein